MKTAQTKNKKTLQGTVVSDKMSKTRVVNVVRKVRHRLYEKVLKRNSRFYAHDENNQSRKGDVVEIISTRPLSKLKRWRVVKVVSKTEG
ncbi:MAG TPA: 30S ribosomal protein S17 [Elusimicrobiales bacterium]|nr:30S ribosomal protein S17 [Elusimicrobiales bacterium]